MLHREPGPTRDHDPSPSWYLDSSRGRSELVAAMVIVAAITIYGILTNIRHITTGGPKPSFLQ